ncbi:YihY/virulence factor BrkB family protein [Deinococcus radiopugnans]|uniref:Membrane protein n=1 Tax=Deinococcus radiopugnans ATCC 19172 TaxID=585398 RepID=A0A5C4Y0G1_9DEIO|nr:YihY/virulence factor BrkB family protein [Deinococcus radiopugnans]MBB6017708.1 membrane protein [Deinococcus radiopugnans ATCC 19172]QLG10732.1 YihY/virulence factor BrkB family protein [Deinococcus sp. D7000]TNM69285.1 YihY/virulence factor BrkB family protein [Deinococcus radiopugnans ATCC 19172]
MRFTPADLFTLLRESALAFSQDKAPRLAAAIAYYAIFAIAPLLFFVLAVASGLLANANVQERLFEFLADNLNQSAVEFVKGIVPDGSRLQQSTLWASIAGFVTLFMGSTGLFVQLQDALNTLWGAEPATGNGILNVIKSRLVSFGLVLLIGVIIIAFLIGNTYLSAIAEHLGEVIGLGTLFVRVATFVVSAGILTVVFAALYKVLPNVKLQWREVWIGSAITSVLFTLGQIGIGIYLGQAAPGSAFGAAGSLVLLLLWIYFSSMVFFFGAEVTWVYSQKFGSGAGGAASVDKKAALVGKGAHISAAPTAQELAARRKEERGGSLPGRLGEMLDTANAKLPRVLPHAPTRAEGRLLPTVRGTLWNAVRAVLAVPAVIVLRLLGWTGGKGGR